METDFIQPQVVSDMTGLSIGALAQLRYHGGGPRFYKPTRKAVLYKHAEVVEWVESSGRLSTAEPPR